MASVAQIQANRSNAQKSTGPRTTAGKERASQNALKHGLLDRMLMYERRIESSLYRTMAELRQEREARTAAAEPEETSRSEGNFAAGQESAAKAKLGSFSADAVTEGGAEEVSSLKCQMRRGKLQAMALTSHSKLHTSNFPVPTSNSKRR